MKIREKKSTTIRQPGRQARSIADACAMIVEAVGRVPERELPRALDCLEYVLLHGLHKLGPGALIPESFATAADPAPPHVKSLFALMRPMIGMNARQALLTIVELRERLANRAPGPVARMLRAGARTIRERVAAAEEGTS